MAKLIITQDPERVFYIQSTSFNSSESDNDEQTSLLKGSNSNEKNSLLNGSINKSKPIVTSSMPDKEVITFADIPMPGLWEQDEAGKHTDRIIVLLFILLASVIVVS